MPIPKLSLAFLLILTVLACNKEPADLINLAETEEPEEIATVTYHGYSYISCAGAIYYLKFDSLITYCSEEGALPDTLSLPNQQLYHADTTVATCHFDAYENLLGDSDNYDVKISYASDSYAVLIDSNFPDAVSENITINLDGTVYQGDEGGRYLGGKRFSTSDFNASVQMVNMYIGGCFHNMLIWELTQ